MKVEIDIPDWAAEFRLQLLAGLELVASKVPGEPWKIKRVRCNQCGECCMDVGRSGPFGADDEGKCPQLTRDGDKWACGAGLSRPYRCLGDPHPDNAPGCCIEYD